MGEGDSKTVLVADDNAALLSMLCVMLKKLGFRVLAAKNGEEAVELFEKEKASIDMLMFDVVMPEMNGCDAAFAIRQERPDLPLLFITGYKDVVPKKDFDRLGDYRIIPKPLSIAYLGEEIRKLLQP